MRKFLLSLVSLIVVVVSFAQSIDVQHYSYDLVLSDQSDVIIGKATIQIKFLSTSSQFKLDLGGPEGNKGMQVLRVYTDDGGSIQFAHKNNELTIKTNAKAGEVKTFEIQYSGVPKDGLIISKNKYGDRTFFADNWPNRAHFWIPCDDRPDDKATFEFSVTAPSKYLIVSNGVKTEEKDLDNGMKLTHWKEDISLPTKVMVIGAARFAVKTFKDSPKNTPVSAWVFQQDSTRGFHDYAPAVDILKFFSNYIAPYPYEKLANVQSKTIFGGMENASAIFYFENSVTGKGDVEDLLAHEIAHQWFGDMASEKSFAHLWLSEGFATYFTDIYWQHKYGDSAFKMRLKKERDEVIEFARTNNHSIVDSTTDLMSLLNANSYQKGGWVLHMLRNEVGDSTFHKIIQAYYEQYKSSNAATRDFEVVAERISERDLKWFFDQWLYRSGIPELKLETRVENGQFILHVKQKEQPFRFNLEIMLVEQDGSVINERLEIKDKESEFKVPIKGSKVSFLIDPNVKLLFSYKE